MAFYMMIRWTVIKSNFFAWIDSPGAKNSYPFHTINRPRLQFSIRFATMVDESCDVAFHGGVYNTIVIHDHKVIRWISHFQVVFVSSMLLIVVDNFAHVFANKCTFWYSFHGFYSKSSFIRLKTHASRLPRLVEFSVCA